jgi:ATP-binding cassette subfamily C (CFTR/MRP) protein 10
MGRFVGTYLGLNDGRIQFLQEMLYGIKGVKSLRFESIFHRKIEDTRTKQLSALGTWMKLTFCVFTSFNQVIPGLAAGGIFVAYYLMGYRLRADVVFPVLTYMNMLYQPVSTASLAISRQFSVRPCWIRIRDFLHSAEQKPYEVDSSLDEQTAIQFRDATFKYHTKEADGADSASSKTLRIGDLDVPANRLTMVIGSTASGKSSLLQALLDELEVVSGSISRTSNMAYVSQNAWVMSGTLRQNIVFMSRFDPVRYQEVIQLCALEQDLAMFPGGDATPVGEIGNNLSGGQRARIALARAIYSDSPILLLDDPLAAVDARVADQLFEGISKLESRTVLLGKLHSLIHSTSKLLTCRQSQITQDIFLAPTVSSS